MPKQKHTFVYFIAWLVIGVFLGLIILLVRGDISLDINKYDNSISATTDTAVAAQGEHRGFSDAVVKAAPAVVSIQTIIWSEPDTENPTEEKLLQSFLGKNSPHRPKKQAETGSGSGVIIQSDGYILTNYHVIKQRDEIRVRLSDGSEIFADAFVLATGTFLRGVLHRGRSSWPGGRRGDTSAIALEQDIRDRLFHVKRFKTGTSPRVVRGSIDSSLLQRQVSHNANFRFSWSSKAGVKNSEACWLTRTTG